ncbi:hypothetical protein BDN72DRAFT_849953 [Pluteus cervinus]|uniref:Uncharacterized protein n=1 Tax=Pluteus cervinus TaxID=181527 RepID=A0ACD3A691_9AGAR|nr:hypothetical protein BDN72DRAFT_849953 [Pluteus cervinus]
MGSFASKGQERQKVEPILKLLKMYDTVIIVDDSLSMSGARWKQAGKALAKLAKLAAEYDEDGLDIFFLNSNESEQGIKDPQEVAALFKRVSPRDLTPIGKRLRGFLEEYITQYRHNSGIKRVNYIVITDGEANDQEKENKVERVIVNAAQKLDDLNAPISQVGIQFVQIGTDESARRFLEMLDDTLKNKYKIRDMVDTTVNFNDGPIDLVKALVGGINKRVDGGTIVTG